jgi:RND superfamily putative drug exporter
MVVIPVVLVIVFLMLALLLRSLAAPLLLVVTVVMSFLASLGVAVLCSRYLFHFAGLDSSVILLGFVFLVALGIDYNVFLAARARQEASAGTVSGVLRALTATGGVITSAGLVLAGTFTVLGVLPLVALTELGFLVAFGVLVDTFLVRSLMVPALVVQIGSGFWWPSHPDPGDGPGEGGTV